MRKLKKNRTLVLTRTAGAVAKALLHDFVFVNHGGPGGWPPGYRSDERELKYSKIFTIFTACSGVLPILVHGQLKKNRTLVLTRTAGAVAKALLHDFVFVNHGGPGGWPPGYRSDER